MNNKGFAISGILYTILVILLISIVMMLFNLQNRKTILDELKADVVDAVESDNNYEYILNEINNLKAQIDNVITDTISLSNSNNAIGELTYYEKNGVVYVNGYIDSSTTNNSINGTFSSLPVPRKVLNIPTSGNNCYVELGIDGVLNNYATCGQIVYFDFSYLTK